jgi:hypothetical protein
MSERSAEPSADPAACSHRWRIAAPNGPTSPGVCRLCGATRDFPNVSDESVWAMNEGNRPVPERFKRTPPR